MFRKLGDGSDRVLAYRLSGTVTDRDVEEIKRDLASAASADKVRMLVEVDDVSGAEPAAVWEDLKATPRYIRDVERLAVVGDRRWQDWLTTLTDTLPIADAEFFEPAHRDDAWNWVQT